MQNFKLSLPINRPTDVKYHILSMLKAYLLKSIKNVNHNFNDNRYYGFIGITLSIIQMTIFFWNLIYWGNDINNDKDLNDVDHNSLFFIKLLRFVYSIDESFIPFYYAYGLALSYTLLLCLNFVLTIFTEKDFANKLFAFFGYFHRFFGFFACQYIFMKATFCNFNGKQYFDIFSSMHIILLIIGVIAALINITLAIITNDFYFKGFYYDSLVNFSHEKSSYFINILGIIGIISNLSEDYMASIKITIATLMLSLSIMRLYFLSRYTIYLKLKMNRLRVFECVHYSIISIAMYCSLMMNNNNIQSASSFIILIYGIVIIVTKTLYIWIEAHQNKVLNKKVEELANDLEAIQHFYAFQGLTIYGISDIKEPGPGDIRRLIINGIMIAHYKSCSDIKCICRHSDYIERKNKPESDSYEKAPIHFSLDSESVENFSKFLLDCYIKRFPNSNYLKLLIIQYYINSSRLSHKGFMMLEKLENHENIEFDIELRLKLLKDQYHQKILDDIQKNTNDSIYIKNMIMYTELQEEFIILLENQLAKMQKFWNELLNNEVFVRNLFIIGKEIFKSEEIIEKYWDQISILVNKRIELPYLIYGLYKGIAYNSSLIADDLIYTYKNILEHVMSVNNDKINHGSHTLYSKNSMYFICSGEIKTMGNIFLSSENVINLIGYNKEELIGKSIDILVPTIYRKFHLEAMLDFSNSGKLEISHDRNFLFYLSKNGIINPCNIYIKLDHHIKYGMIFLGVIKLIKTNSNYILIDINGDIDSATKDITHELSLNRKQKHENNLSKTLNIEQYCIKFEEINSVCNTIIQANKQSDKNLIYTKTNSSNNHIDNDKNRHKEKYRANYDKDDNDNDNNSLNLYNQLSMREYEKMNEYYNMLNEGIELKFHLRTNNKRSCIYNNLKRSSNHPASVKTISYIAKITDRIYKNNNIVRIIELNKPYNHLQTQISFAKSSKNKDKSILDCIEEEYLDDLIVSNPRDKNHNTNLSQNNITNSQNLRMLDLSSINTKYENTKFTPSIKIQTQFQRYNSHMNLDINDNYKNHTETIPKLETSIFDNEKILEINNSFCENINDEGTIDQINNFHKTNIKDYSFINDSELIHFNSISPNISNISFSFHNMNNENAITDKDHHKHKLIKNNHDHESNKKLSYNDDNRIIIENPEIFIENKSERIAANHLDTSTTAKQFETSPTLKPSSSTLKQQKQSLVKTKEIESKMRSKNLLPNNINLLRHSKQKRILGKQITGFNHQIEQSIGTGTTSRKRRVQQTVEKAVLSPYCSKYVKYMKILFFMPIFLNLSLSIASYLIQKSYINAINNSMKAIQYNYKQLDYIVEMNRRSRLLLLLKQGYIDENRHEIDEIPVFSTYIVTKIIGLNANLKYATNLMEFFLFNSMEPLYRDQISNEKIKVYWNSTTYLDYQAEFLFFDAIRTYIFEVYNTHNLSINTTMSDEMNASFMFILRNALNGYLVGLTNASLTFQRAVQDSLGGVKINMYVNITIGIILAIVFLVFFSISVVKLIKERIIVFKRISTIDNSKIRLILERLNILRIFLKSANKNHYQVDQILENKNNIEFKFGNIDNLNSKKAKNSILNIKDFQDKFWVIGSKIIFIGIFVTWYYISIAIIFSVYEQNFKSVTIKINKTYSILTKQGLQMSTVYEYISEGDTMVLNQPILNVINASLYRGELYSELLNTFGDDTLNMDSINRILSQSLCYIKAKPVIDRQCVHFCDGISTKGLLALIAFIERVLSDIMEKYSESDQGLAIKRELLNDETLIEMEAIFYNYSRVALYDILKYLNIIFDDNTDKLVIIQLILLMIYILSILIMALTLINPLMKKLKEENVSSKKFLRLIPTTIIINNKNLTKFLIDTSPKYFNLNRYI